MQVVMVLTVLAVVTHRYLPNVWQRVFRKKLCNSSQHILKIAQLRMTQNPMVWSWWKWNEFISFNSKFVSRFTLDVCIYLLWTLFDSIYLSTQFNSTHLNSIHEFTSRAALITHFTPSKHLDKYNNKRASTVFEYSYFDCFTLEYVVHSPSCLLLSDGDISTPIFFISAPIFFVSLLFISLTHKPATNQRFVN